MTERGTLPFCFTQASGNPYARIDAEAEEALALARGSATRRERPHLTTQMPLIAEAATRQKAREPIVIESGGNPYANLNDEDDLTATELNSGMSKAECDARMRSVFRPYVPASRRTGPLPPLYRDFIGRTLARSPVMRQRIVAQLERYALSDVPDLATQFNRERAAITAEKLHEIERLAEGGE